MSAFIALLATALFAGAALYVSVAEHPSRSHLTPGAAVIQFRHSYARAAVMQALLAAIGFVAGAVTAYQTGRWPWLLAAILIGLPIPFTLAIMMPINNRLKSGTLGDTEIAVLFRHWGRLHGVRTAASLAALAIMISVSSF